MRMSKESVTLIDNRTGKEYEFPILKSTLGPDVVDISTFYGNTGMFTLDRIATNNVAEARAMTIVTRKLLESDIR